MPQHYVWGVASTNNPTSGSLTYTLHSATTPTYVGAAAATAGGPGTGSFDGTFSVDFASVGARIGIYHLSGTVTMNEPGGAVGEVPIPADPTFAVCHRLREFSAFGSRWFRHD